MAAMGEITVKIDDSALGGMLKERDALRDRIAELEATPLEFSLEKLARDVRKNYMQNGYTPNQCAEITSAICAMGRPKDVTS